MSDSILAEAVGIIDGVNVDFDTTAPYVVGSVYAFLNGVLVQQSGDEGPIEMGGTAVRMRVAPKLRDTLHFVFQTGLPTPSPGAFLPPPRPISSTILAPTKPVSSKILVPKPYTAEEE